MHTRFANDLRQFQVQMGLRRPETQPASTSGYSCHCGAPLKENNEQLLECQACGFVTPEAPMPTEKLC